MNNLATYNNPVFESSSRDEDVCRHIWFEMFNLSYEFVEWAFDTNLVSEDDNYVEKLTAIRSDKKIHEDYEDYRYEKAEQEYYN